MVKNALSPEMLYQLGKRIERRNSRKTFRSRIIAEKLNWQDLAPYRFRKLKKKAARLSRHLEVLEIRRQDVLRLLKVKLMKETGGIYG